MNHQFFQDFIIPKNLLHDLDRQRTQINLIRVLPIAIIFLLYPKLAATVWQGDFERRS